MTTNIKFRGSDAFHRSLRARVDRYFRLTGRRPRDCTAMYLKAATLLVWFAASYSLLVFVATQWWQALPLALSLGLSIAGLGFCVQHDGNHGAFSSRPWINRLAALCLDLIGGSSYHWSHKHNTIHHTFANVVDHDDDIDVGWFGRLAPGQAWRPMHRYQHIYLWLLYGFLPMKWHFVDDFRDVIRGRIGSHPFARPKGLDLAIFLGGKATFFTLAFVLPSLFHPVWQVVLVYFLTFWVTGFVISVVFQLAHVVEPAHFPVPDPASGTLPTHWAEHQVETTVDFARGNPFLTWFLGGLNFQVEHHLFPRVCHINYARISRLVENECRRHGLQYNTHATLWQAIASHFRWLRHMGQSAA